MVDPDSVPPRLTRRNVLAGSCALAAGIATTSAAAGDGRGAGEDGPDPDGRTEPAASQPDDVEARVADLVTESLEEHDVPGAAVAVVRDGEVTMAEGYGVADREDGTPVEPTTPFRIGSVSKPVVWTAIARLVDRGELDPETPVSTYLDDDLVSWDDPVTLANLATHTAGFEATNRGMWYADPADVGPLPAHLDPMPAQVRSPGAVGSYSNHGVAVAGQALASVAGDPFPDAMDDLLFGPAGLEASSFHQPPPDPLSDAHATGHDAAVADKFAGLGIAPAGGMSASAADMGRFMALHLNDGVVDGERVLESDTVAFVQRQWFTHHEELAGTTFGFVERNVGDVRVLRHNGGTPGFHANVVLVPELEFGLFVAYNGANAARPREAVPAAVLEAVLPDPDPEPLEPEGAPTRAAELEGTYRSLRAGETAHDSLLTTLQAASVDVSVADDGALLVESGGDRSRWIELEPLLFRREDGDDRLAFGESDGEITYLFRDGSATALERTSWHESPSLHLLAGAGSLVGLGSGWLSWSPSRDEDESRREWLASVRSDRDRLSTLAVHGASAALLAFIVLTLLYLFYDAFALLSDPSVLYRLTFALPVVGAVAAVAAAILAVRLWVTGDWSRRRRLHYSFVAGSTVVVTAILWYWNLLLPP